MLAGWPTGRRIAVSALVCLWAAVLIVTAVRGWAANYPVFLLQSVSVAAGAVCVVGLAVALVTSRLSDYREPAGEEEFERVVRRSERLAKDNLAAEPDESEFETGLDPHDPEDFEALIGQALDDLPDLLFRALRHVAVVISDDGRRHGAYGLYQGDGVARDDYPDRIVIFRDTLVRDFGRDPDALRDQVTRTVRHELAHHLGADELGVRELGL